MNIFLNILTLVLACASAHAFSKSLYQPAVPDELTVYFLGNDAKSYYELIDMIHNDKAENVKSKFKKKKMDANILYRDPYRGEVFAPAKVRMTGDWKDHFDAEKQISSLSVQLKNENIGNIVKFRLLLPKTRLGDNEIFWSILMEEMGYPVPYRKIVQVNLNDIAKFDAIFEEGTEKEFLERFRYRESPVIEADERQIWDNRIWMHVKGRCLRKHNDGSCNPPGDPPYTSYKVDNSAFLKSDISNQIGMDALRITTTTNSKRFKKVNRRDASHGLVKSNRKWIFDPIYGVHIPIYFDGNVFKHDKCKPKNMAKNISLQHKAAIERVREEFHQRNGTTFTDLMLCAATEHLEPQYYAAPETVKITPANERLQLQWLKPLPVYPTITPKIISRIDSKGGIHICNNYDIKTRKPYNCSALSSSQARKYIGGNGKPYKYDNYNVYPVVYSGEKRQKPILKLIKSIPQPDVISIPKNTIYYFSLGKTDQKITVFLEDNQTSKAVFVNTQFGANAEVHVSSEPYEGETFAPISRYNERLLTSCLTFVDSSFKQSSITVINGACEDSLNFVRSKGTLKKVRIENAVSDALDADFSFLTFNQLEVKNAGNDCIDLSAGYYHIANSTVTGCSDKGISAGERARVAVQTISITDTDLGLVSKDSSKLHVNKINTKNVAKCGAAYRKKQEFIGAELLYSQGNKCRGSTDNKYSKVKASKVLCSRFFTLNSGEGCIKGNQLVLNHPSLLLGNKWQFVTQESQGQNKQVEPGRTRCKKHRCVTTFPIDKFKNGIIAQKISRQGYILEHYAIEAGLLFE